MLSGIASDDEATELEALNDWVAAQSFARGEMAFDLIDTETREQRAILDLVWLQGVQAELIETVAVLSGMAGSSTVPEKATRDLMPV